MILNFVNCPLELPFFIQYYVIKIYQSDFLGVFLVHYIPLYDCTVISLSIFLSVDTAAFPGFCNCEQNSYEHPLHVSWGTCRKMLFESLRAGRVARP